MKSQVLHTVWCNCIFCNCRLLTLCTHSPGTVPGEVVGGSIVKESFLVDSLLASSPINPLSTASFNELVASTGLTVPTKNKVKSTMTLPFLRYEYARKPRVKFLSRTGCAWQPNPSNSSTMGGGGRDERGAGGGGGGGRPQKVLKCVEAGKARFSYRAVTSILSQRLRTKWRFRGQFS